MYSFRFTLSFGGIFPEDNQHDYIVELARKISTETAGLNIQRGTGFWREDGNDPNPPYTGNFQDERSVTFVVRVDADSDHKRDEFLASMRSIFRDVSGKYCAPVDWIDVEYHSVSTSHFSVN
jgi:hypothetical protein